MTLNVTETAVSYGTACVFYLFYFKLKCTWVSQVFLVYTMLRVTRENVGGQLSEKTDKGDIQKLSFTQLRLRKNENFKIQPKCSGIVKNLRKVVQVSMTLRDQHPVEYNVLHFNE